MKIYLHHDTGCAYRIEAGEILFYPLSIKNEVIDTDSDEWGAVEYNEVGEEVITHEGEEITINQLNLIIRSKLT